ncbi:MAG TPA: glycosyltransferase family 4 protein [Xanthobacteraceae bacterium]
MVKAVVFAVPGDLATPTGGYTYDRRIIDELRRLGWSVDALDIGEDFPRPTAKTRGLAFARLGAIPVGRGIVIDGLAFGVLQNEAKALRTTHPLVALVHHPLAFETGLSAQEAQALQASERDALSAAHWIVVTSAATARLLVGEYGVSPERLTVVRPGTDRPETVVRGHGGTVALLAVGSIVPRKGYDVLVAALAQVKDLPWRLMIAGDRMRSAETARRLEQDIVTLGLGDRITLLGAVGSERLDVLYAAADLFVVPSRFEGYGMAFAEAMAHGLPVVATTAGAISETVPADAGILVEPDDAGALAGALRQLISCHDARSKLAAGARRTAGALPTWRESGALFARVLDGVL